MKLKKLLVSFITLSIFITGCSTINRKEVVSDKAKQQQTMTKVQNDVNEIMSKDYEYVLKNMGTPYSTTYWIDKDKINNTQTIEELNETGTVGLVYPKYTADNELEGSALYIELNNNKVVEVQTYDFGTYAIEDDVLEDSSLIVMDKYSNEGILELSDIENMNLNNFKGKYVDELYKDLKYINPNINAYDMVSKSKSIEVYKLKSNNFDSNKTLMIFLDDKKINNINIVDDSLVIKQARDYFNQ